MRHERRLWLVVLALAGGSGAALSVTEAARADGGFYCDRRVVQTGDAAYQVRSLCGAPDDIQQRTETRTVRERVRVPCAVGLCDTMIERSFTVPVEEWVYDFGRQRFMQHLTFEQGTLIRVRSGVYGRKLASNDEG
ncbi:MAG: DUF2845 domain-containing protein [Polyangiales bacterium]